MASSLNKSAVVKDGYIVAKTAGGKSVTDKDRGLSPDHLVEFRIDLEFSQRIKRRRGLVEDYKRRILI